MAEKDCEKQQIYQVVDRAGLPLFATPNSAATPLQKISSVLLVRRLNYIVYDDLTPGTGNKFFYIAVSNDLVGYALAYTVNNSGVKTFVGLGQTVAAALAQPKFEELLKKQHKDCKKKCGK